MRSFLDLARAFNNANVGYVVVGGLAVVLHGSHRLTGDVDIVLNLDPQNLESAIDILVENDWVPRIPVHIRELLSQEKRREWIEDKNLVAFSLYRRSDPVAVLDILLAPSIEFENVAHNAVSKFLGDVEVPVASIERLIAMKAATGRPQDEMDIQELRNLRSG